MIIGIDACNIRDGGALIHLIEFLSASDPQKHLFEEIIIWSNENTLKKLPNQPWLKKRSHNTLNKSFFYAFFFQKFILARQAKDLGCDILFVPGGAFLSSFRPFVTISQNMLPFEKKELERYKERSFRVKFRFLKIVQSHTFKQANGLIFLTKYARKVILNTCRIPENNIIIPHGSNPQYISFPKAQKSIDRYSNNNPFRLLYVSKLAPYKHQWTIAEAVCRLHKKGMPIHLILVGPSEAGGEDLLKLVLEDYSNSKDCIKYYGEIQHAALFDLYKQADSFIFGSTCENLPVILIEAMSAGLPILSSSYGPMPEILGENGGMYFDPENVDDIEIKLQHFVSDQETRSRIAYAAYHTAITYSWTDMTDKTYSFITRTLEISKKNLI
ncbi:glycosyltransferase [Niabella aquatica]